MIYLERAAGGRVRPWVRSLWYCRAPECAHRRERVLPNGCMQIILNLRRSYLTDCGEEGAADQRLPAAIVVGARARYEVIDTGDLAELAGIVIEPGGFAGLFRERADLFFEQSVDLDGVWEGQAAGGVRTRGRVVRGAGPVERLCEAGSGGEKLRVLEELLNELVDERARRSALVDQAMWEFEVRGVNVEECARSVGVSERRLSEVFREHVGIAPKMWCRVRRFQAAVGELHRGTEVPWAELALECGYYDQAHFVNDFRGFSGMDPTSYVRKNGRWQNHVVME
jgi:AraC-like DNA-binding protein